MNLSLPARAPGELLFQWERPRGRRLAIAGFLLLSAGLHAFGFYVFQIVYPPPIALLPPPAQVTVIAPTSPEARTFLNWLNAEDPALSSQTQRPADARAFQLPKLAHIPSYVAVKPQLKELATPREAAPAPLAFPPQPVKVHEATATPARFTARTTLVFSNPALNDRMSHSDFKFRPLTRETPESARFLVAVDSLGVIRYVFLEHSSGDAALDAQAHRYLVLGRFAPPPTIPPNEQFAWSAASFEFGNDFPLPTSSTEQAP